MKKVAIIGTVGVPGCYGGFETLAHQLVNHLDSTFNLRVYCSKKAYKKSERQKHYKNARLYYLPFSANGVQSVIYDFISIFHAIFIADTLVILGVSGGLMIPFVRLFTNKKIIVNIDGLEWRRAKWNRFAKVFLRFSEKVAVRWSHADVTDNEAIKRYTSRHYKTLSHLIEYGGDHALKIKPEKKDHLEYPFLHQPYAFKVARIEPENNIHMILESFASLSQVLVVVGNWDKSGYGQSLKEKYIQYENIYLIDAIYDQRKLDVLRSNCTVYIHGHSAGGTNPSLVEAMYLGLRIIAFDCVYNRATTEQKALYFKNVNDLISVIKNTAFKDLIVLGSKMLEIAQRRYIWQIISNRYENLIHGFDYAYKKQNLQGQISTLDNTTLINQGISHLKNPTLYFEEL